MYNVCIRIGWSAFNWPHRRIGTRRQEQRNVVSLLQVHHAFRKQSHTLELKIQSNPYLCCCHRKSHVPSSPPAEFVPVFLGQERVKNEWTCIQLKKIEIKCISPWPRVADRSDLLGNRIGSETAENLEILIGRVPTWRFNSIAPKAYDVVLIQYESNQNSNVQWILCYEYKHKERWKGWTLFLLPQSYYTSWRLADFWGSYPSMELE